MKHGEYPTMDEVVRSNNQKGDLIEYILYDYFSASGYDVSLLKTFFDDSKLPHRSSQRFEADEDIIVPDLICQNKYKDIIFIESKGRWHKNLNEPVDGLNILVKTFNSYVKFYNSFYDEFQRIMCPTNVLLCFAIVDYTEDVGARISMNFIKMQTLNDMPHGKYWDRQNKENYFWRNSDLIENSFQIKNTSFKYDADNNVFYSKFCDDIYAKDRSVLVAETKTSVRKILKDWLWNT